jgi:hypothetical protein
MTEENRKKEAEAEKDKLTGGLQMASLPDEREMGTVMIELPVNQAYDEGINKTVESLESKGWKVLWRRNGDPSMEDTSEGIDTGKPVVGTESGDNNIINGVSLPKIDDHSVYKVVKLVRPEDTVPDGESDILYLMNGQGDVKEYLEHEGYLVVDEDEKLHTALVAHGA